jgi:integrase
MRHTYATIAIGVAGVPIKVVSQRTGHANVNLTMGTYAHVLPGDHEAAATATVALILGTRLLPPRTIRVPSVS